MPVPPIKVGADKDFQNVSIPINLPAPENTGDAVRKIYVDTIKEELSLAITGQGIPLPLDCSADPNYPSSEPGYVFIVPTGGGGKIGGAAGITVADGDRIHCIGIQDPADPGNPRARLASPGGDQATVGDQFFVTEGNREAATTDKLGLAKKATQVQVDAGVDTDSFVTSATLAQRLLNLENSNNYTAAIGDGIQDLFTITHNLGTVNVNVVIRETTSGDLLETYWKPINANNIQLGFSSIPSANFYTVNIRK